MKLPRERSRCGGRRYNEGMRSASRLVFLALGVWGACFAQQYDGPPPPKADVPYLLHAENLIETEHQVAQEEMRKKEIAYIVTGERSPVKTPLAEPIFIILAEKFPPQAYRLYKMEVVKGHRETAFPRKPGKRGPRPRYLTFDRVNDNVYKLEANEYLENGQYCLTPQGANDVFCFEIY